MNKQGTSSSSPVELTALLAIVFFYPIGVFLLWFKTKWPVWVKLLISVFALPLLLIQIIVLMMITGVPKPSPQGREVPAIIKMLPQYKAYKKQNNDLLDGNQRNNMQILQQQVEGYYNLNKKYPESLDELAHWIPGGGVANDIYGQPYEYETTQSQDAYTIRGKSFNGGYIIIQSRP